VSGVVPAVPRVAGQRDGERDLAAVLRVQVATGEVVVAERAQQRRPATVERVEELERDLDRSGRDVPQLGPAGLVVGLYRRRLFGERELEPHVAVEVAVGEMVDDLADGPAAGAVRASEVGGAGAGERVAQLRR
jgi:hypothetical protein